MNPIQMINIHKLLNVIFPYSNEIAELTLDKESEEIAVTIAGNYFQKT